MSVIQAVLLGFIQGLTEFLPVSSSGHLFLAKHLMNIEDVPVIFDIILHLATLSAIIWVFRLRILRILRAFWRGIRKKMEPSDKSELNLALLLVVATVITASIGIFLSGFEFSPIFVGTMFLATGVLLLLTLKAKGAGHLYNLKWTTAIATGIAQGLGVMPGISRSGITISTALLAGLDRKSAGELSFLLSIPAILGAFILKLKDLTDLSDSIPAVTLFIGFTVALISGYVFLRLLLWLISEGKLWVFSFYLFGLGSWAVIYFMP